MQCTLLRLVSSRFATLTAWLVHDGIPQPAIFNALLPHLPIAFKSPRGRQEILAWIRPYLSLGEPRQFQPILSSVLDALLDKSKETRSNASAVLETLIHRCGADVVRSQIGNRKPTDEAQLRSFIDAFDLHPIQDEPPIEPRTTESSFGNTENNPAIEKSDERAARMESMARRPGVRLLTKPKLGPDGKPLPKFNVVSSIPKPIPRRTLDNMKSRSSQVVFRRPDDAPEEINDDFLREMRDEVPTEIDTMAEVDQFPSENVVPDDSGVSLNSSEGAFESPKRQPLPAVENVNDLRLSFAIPIKSDDLLLEGNEEPLNMQSRVLSSFSLKSSQFTNEFISSLRHSSLFFHDGTTELAITYREQISNLHNMIDTLTELFCPVSFFFSLLYIGFRLSKSVQNRNSERRSQRCCGENEFLGCSDNEDRARHSEA